MKESEQMKARIITKLKKKKGDTDFFFPCLLYTAVDKVKMGPFHTCLSVAVLLYSAEGQLSLIFYEFSLGF